MDEKEFLTKFLLDQINRNLFATDYSEKIEEGIDEFLRIHHMKYKQVYFYEWEGKEKDIVKEQVKIKLRDFADFLIDGSGLNYDYEKLEAKINAYIERTIK